MRYVGSGSTFVPTSASLSADGMYVKSNSSVVMPALRNFRRMSMCRLRPRVLFDMIWMAGSMFIKIVARLAVANALADGPVAAPLGVQRGLIVVCFAQVAVCVGRHLLRSVLVVHSN